MDGCGDLPADYHIAVCSRDGFNARRHNHVQNTIRLEAALRGQSSELATQVNKGTPGLIADLHFPNISGKGGKSSTVVDVAICHHSAGLPVRLHGVPLASSAAREQEKVDMYQRDCDENLFEFMPLVFESTGALGQSAKDFLRLLLANSCLPADEFVPSAEFESLIQPVIVALHKAIADKYIAASEHFRGEAYRYNNARFALDESRSWSPLAECRWD